MWKNRWQVFGTCSSGFLSRGFLIKMSHRRFIGTIWRLPPKWWLVYGKLVSVHKGRGRKIKSGQKVHSSVAFCDERYHPRAILPNRRRLCELVGKGSRSTGEWVKGWEDLIEMDIFDLASMSNVIEKLKSGTGSESSMWAYRLTALTSTGGHCFMLDNSVSDSETQTKV